MSCRSQFVLIAAAGLLSCSSAAMMVEPVTQCHTNEKCTIRGTLIASHGMGAIKDRSGCIAVALPEKVPSSWSGRTVEASGGIYKAPDYPGLVTYKLRGRNVDAEACYSGIAMFVDHIVPILDHRD